ncbi:MAG TPA: response regulator transcription factor [Gemmatimonadaceae bacterium]|nr:response regulator transcription factor [Gemmatimonadaceae bacterium]
MTNVWQPTGTSEVAVDRSILIIEDNETLALGLRTSLEVEGYKVECITDGNDGLAWLSQNSPDLIVLDLMLPGLNGFEVLRRYRARGGAAAVLILSARDQEVDKVQGFRIGADDYVVKPIGVLEFLARVEAIIRRLAPAGRGSAGAGDGAARTALHRFSDVVVDLRTRTVLRGGKAVDLSPMEFDFLSFLIESGGDIVSRETLMRQVWRYSLGVTSRTVDQHVARLRNKLEPDPAQPRHLITVRKAGYRFQR